MLVSTMIAVRVYNSLRRVVIQRKCGGQTPIGYPASKLEGRDESEQEGCGMESVVQPSE